MSSVNPGPGLIPVVTPPGVIVNAEGVPADGDVPTYVAATDSVSWQAGGGGGSQPKKSEYLCGPTSVPADGTDTLLEWSVNTPTGDDLFDLTDPANPVAVEAGTYIVAANTNGLGFNATGVSGDRANVRLDMDADGFEWYMDAAVALDGPSGIGLVPPLTGIGYIPAGGRVAMIATFIYAGGALSFTVGPIAVFKIA